MLHNPPFVRLDRPPAEVTMTVRTDGEIILECPRPLGPVPSHIMDILDASAARYPDRTFLAQRGEDGAWRHLSYAETKAKAACAAQWLLDQGIGPERPVMILSGNSLEHAILALGAMQIGAPAVPVSVAYSLMSKDFAKLGHVFDLARPGLVFVQDGAQFAGALAALDLSGVRAVYVKNRPERLDAVPFDEVMSARPGPEIAAARARQTPDTIAKILFTSGSTGAPKGVINTQRMLCCVPKMIADISEPEDPDNPPVILDWLPWNHTFGSNANFNSIMYRGGTLYIDGGLPTPEMFHITLANLKDVSPTRFSTVPAAYAMLADALEQDEELREKFFARMKLMSYGGAPLSQDLYERMQALAIKTIGKRLHFATGHGATETGAFDTAVYWECERVGLIGLPAAGTKLKLVPQGDLFEVRVKGPQVTPGYYRRPDLTDAAFDEDGYFRLGDAARWVDPRNPKAGLTFAGRISENFKLSNGTWVAVAGLRAKLLEALSPLVSDMLVTGADAVAVLAWPNMEGVRARAAGLGLGDDLPAGELVFHPKIAAEIKARLARHNADNPAASLRVERFAMMTEPPSIDANEITDKRYINQRAALERRADLVAALLADPPDARAILP